MSLFQKIRAQREDVILLVTGVHDIDEPGVYCADFPAETAAATREFLSFWKPTACLWFGNTFHPALIDNAARLGCHMVLLQSDRTTVRTQRRWMNKAAQAVLPEFSDAFTIDKAAGRSLIRQGLPSGRLRATGRLSETPRPLPCSIDEQEWFANHLAGRPVWLAARVTATELDTVLRAHRHANRLAHRLLLFLSPRPECPLETIQSTARQIGLRTLLWDEETLPDEATQVMIIPDPDMLGLLYRLSPVSFLGGTLEAGIGGTDPYEAASLGSAILHGPNVGSHLDSIERLRDVGAAHVVTDADALSKRLTALLAPDAQAEMAMAAWDLVSKGAAVADEVTELVINVLDQAEKS